MQSSVPRPPSGSTDEDPFVTPLGTPRPAFLSVTSDPSLSGYHTPRQDSYGLAAPAPATSSIASVAAIAPVASESESESEKPPRTHRTPLWLYRPLWRRPLFWLIVLAVIVAIVLAVVLPVVLVADKHRTSSASAGSASASTGDSGGTSGGSGPSEAKGATTGGNGSTIVTLDGSKVTYINNFGGFWVDDPNDPFNTDARPNSWTPPLNTSWTWGKDRIYGVNLGGWFELEPFITPALFQKYTGAVDEWTLSEAMAADTASGGLQAQLEDHYNTFITEKDFIQIAGAGLNWIRLPIPFWAIETWDGEPFLERVCWKYILRAFSWARKYGLRIYLDLHTVPGSQNGYNHSGRLGQVNFMHGLMGLANAQRTLSYIRIFTEFITQAEYRDVVPLFGIINEALITQIGKDEMSSFYVEAMDMIRSNITGYGAGNGPLIAIHDGFLGLGGWANYLPGSDRLVMDTHPYFAFDGQLNNAPIAAPIEGMLNQDDGASGGTWPKQACDAWADTIDTSQSAFGITVAGEFSNAINDCGLFINGVGNGPTYQFDCTPFNEWQSWNDSMKSGFKEFTLASMDAMQDWFFWTWKIAPSNASTVDAPLWSYQLGLENGWMPPDPRASVGKCAALVSGAATTTLKTYSYAASQTGGAGAPSPQPSSLAQSFPWPPTVLSGFPPGVLYPALAPTYTPTGPVSTLPMPSVTKGVSEGDGWANTADAGGAYTPVAGCSYANAWDSVGAVAPTAACGAGGATQRRRWVEARATPAPSAR